MIHYDRTSWYGLEYFLMWRGSVFPRCLPITAVSCVVNWAVLQGYINFSDKDSDEWLAHPYTFQLVGIVFGYLMVTRISMSYSRYWEGVTMIKNMHSKWADACGQIIAFDRSLYASRATHVACAVRMYVHEPLLLTRSVLSLCFAGPLSAT
jgi:predicted membrane chloride channel (bestrophin family)